MSYLVLARKFRPQTFASIIGQEHISTALANAIIREKVAHAFLFTGPRGVGKTSMARVLARALNCTGRPAVEELAKLDEAKARELVEPCGECANCKEIARSASMAVWEIDGASNNSVDNVRELIESLRSLPPSGSRYKIYIIDEVHMLSTAAFNALLKSLEEPPPHTVFIFATTEPHKIPETVASRCQVYDFRRLTVETIVSCLQEIAEGEGIKADEAVFEFIARRAEGGMRDAQSMLDRLNSFSGEKIELQQVLKIFGVVDKALFFGLSKAIIEQDAKRCIELLDQAFGQSIDIRQFVTDFVVHFRNLLLGSVIVEQNGNIAALSGMLELSKPDLQQIAEQARLMSNFDFQRLFDVAQEVSDRALQSNYPRFVLEAGLVKMATLPSLRPLAEVLADVQGLASGRTVSQVGSQAPRTAAPSRPVSVSPGASENRPAPSSAETRTAPGMSTRISDAGQFNPSWHDFVSHVRSRSEVRVAAFLRRVSPRIFVLGKLEIAGSEFDLQSLREPGTLAILKNCLESYSRHDGWEVRFETVVGGVEASGDRKVVGKAASLPPGSIAEGEAEVERLRVRQIEEEAKSHPIVQAALSTFDGSKIERVSRLKP